MNTDIYYNTDEKHAKLKEARYKTIVWFHSYEVARKDYSL